MSEKQKLHPRNATAWQTKLVAGNTANSRLESGVGNCFPGLEADIRNLERRFIPHMAVDFSGRTARVVAVDMKAVNEAGLPQADADIYREVARDANDPSSGDDWFLARIEGRFGPFGDLDLGFNDYGPDDRPADAWTAVRLLPEGRDVTIGLQRQGNSPIVTAQLTAPRSAYVTEDGALSEIFEPGELSQSLCSPWTHDFRDCGCFYWSSNHPDIALPFKPAGSPPDSDFDQHTAWQRTREGATTPPPPALAERGADEMRHYEINHRWEHLGIVLDGREQAAVYTPPMFTADPFQTVDELVAQVRYAAGVELGVTLEYLSAAYSLDRAAAGGTLADDVRASFFEIIRIAVGEMKHIRAANDILRAFFERGLIPAFEPALRVANELPAGGGTSRPLQFRRLTMETLDSFIDIERPSFSVDGLYGRILATVKEEPAPGPLESVVGSIMADGTDHFETFSFIKEWLGQHSEDDYLLDLDEPDDTVAEHTALQTAYQSVLELLHQGYALGLPGGATAIDQARTAMLARPDGLQDLCEKLADAQVRVTFKAPDDPRFAPIGRP